MNSLRQNDKIPGPWDIDEPSCRVDYRLLMEEHSEIQEEWRERGEVDAKLSMLSSAGFPDIDGYIRLLEEHPDCGDMILDSIPEEFHSELEFMVT